MSDSTNHLHDLAIAAAAISACKNFEIEAVGDTATDKRISFANYLQEEYEYFLKYYQSKTK